MQRLKLLSLAVLSTALIGCPHRYAYTHTSPDGEQCTVTIDSYETVHSGALAIDDFCQIDSGAKRIGMDPAIAEAMGKTLIELGQRVP